MNPGDVAGFPYAENLNRFFLVEVGDPEGLGVLELVCREVIWKNFARVDWSTASERFGMPFVFMKTHLDDDTEVAKRARMLANFGSKGWGIGDVDDEIQFVETSKTDFYKIYAENAKYCDEQISKLINGQTGTSDEKSFVGSAEVHERILDNFTDRRLRSLTNVINYELIPFLVFHGYPLDGMEFRFTELDPKEEKKVGSGSRQEAVTSGKEKGSGSRQEAVTSGKAKGSSRQSPVAGKKKLSIPLW
jgi:hypothetical protein